MEVYAVIWWDDYYPSPDNVLKMFKSWDKACSFLEEVSSVIYKEVRYKNYEIVTYEVEE
jgi:hypothetical protein